MVFKKNFHQLIFLVIFLVTNSSATNLTESEDLSKAEAAALQGLQIQLYLVPPETQQQSEYEQYANVPEPTQNAQEQVPASVIPVVQVPVDQIGQLSQLNQLGSIGQIQAQYQQVGQIVPVGHFLYQRHTEDTLDHRPITQSTNPNDLPKERNHDTERNAFDTKIINEPSAELSVPAIEQEPNYYVIHYNEENKKFKRNKEKKAENHELEKKSSSLKKKEKLGKVNKKFEKLGESEEGPRVDFQMHNHDGPSSYKFGYDTGNDGGKDRQFRMEERDSAGNVKGVFGYLDRNQRMKIFNYSSSASQGFQIHPS